MQCKNSKIPLVNCLTFQRLRLRSDSVHLRRSLSFSSSDSLERLLITHSLSSCSKCCCIQQDSFNFKITYILSIFSLLLCSSCFYKQACGLNVEMCLMTFGGNGKYTRVSIPFGLYSISMLWDHSRQKYNIACTSLSFLPNTCLNLSLTGCIKNQSYTHSRQVADRTHTHIFRLDTGVMSNHLDCVVASEKAISPEALISFDGRHIVTSPHLHHGCH